MPTYLQSKITLIGKTLKGGEPTFINTDSLSFSRLTIFMATFWHVTQWTPSLTSPAQKKRKKKTQQKQTIKSAGGDNIKIMCSEDPWKATNTQIVKPVIVPNGDILCRIIYMKKAKLFCMINID